MAITAALSFLLIGLASLFLALLLMGGFLLALLGAMCIFGD